MPQFYTYPTAGGTMDSCREQIFASDYLSLSACKLARGAAFLGGPDLGERHEVLSNRAIATWRHWRDTAVGTQTGYRTVFPFGIAPPNGIAAAGARLAVLVNRRRAAIPSTTARPAHANPGPQPKRPFACCLTNSTGLAVPNQE